MGMVSRHVFIELLVYQQSLIGCFEEKFVLRGKQTFFFTVN